MKKKITLKPIISKKSLRYGGYSLAITALVIALIVLVNVAMSALETNFDLKLDMTQTRKYSLSLQTEQLLKENTTPIRVYTLFTQSLLNTSYYKDVQVLLDKFVAASDQITIENIDLNTNPGFTEKFDPDRRGIAQGSIVVSDAEGQRYRVLDQYDIFAFETSSDYSSTVVSQITVEGSLASAIDYIISGYMPNVYFLQGHGEKTPFELSAIQSALTDANYNVTTINLREQPDTLLAGDIVVVFGPTADLLDEEREILKALMDKGGRFMFYFDPTIMVKTKMDNFNSLLRLYNVELQNGIILEGNAGYTIQNTPLALVPAIATNTITQPVREKGYPYILPYAGGVKLPDVVPESNMTITPLLTTSNTAWLNTDLEDLYTKPDDAQAGPFVLAAIMERNYGSEEENVKVLVVNNVNSVLNSDPFGTNASMFIETAAWMRNADKGVYVRGKTLSNAALVFANTAQFLIVTVVSCFLIPVLLFVASIVIYIKRKHL